MPGHLSTVVFSTVKYNKKVIETESTLIQQFGSLYLDDKYSDVTFKIQGLSIPAHKLILSTRSTYFDALLNGGLKESSLSEVSISEDTPLEAFRQIIQFIYTGKITFDSQNEDQILEVLALVPTITLT